MTLQRIRDYLRTDMKILRWVFVGLYAVLMPGLFCYSPLGFDAFATLILFGVIFGAQALFIFGSGTIRLCHPIRRRRLLIPILVAAFMFGLLTLGVLMASFELFKLNIAPPFAEWFLLIIPILVWLFWGLVFWRRYSNCTRFDVMASLVKWLLSGSLLELVVCVPSHLIVGRRPGCMVGLFTMFGIICGLCVMCFAFGPALVLLFLRPRYRQELADAKAAGIHYCDTCGYDLRASDLRCPECGTPFAV